jgi:serine phosphatase RsbU (regulator of sigma subunit)/CHASE2 domain-containing sensor protein
MPFRRVTKYISIARAATTTLAVAAVATAAALSPLGASTEDLLLGRLVFRARSALGADPEISPRLKIFVVDDPTVSFLDRFDPTLSDWASVIEAIALRRPRAIVVDKLFDSPFASDEAKDFAQRIGALDTPVHVGVFVTDHLIVGRDAMTLDRPELAWQAFLTKGENGSTVDDDAWPVRDGHVYGSRRPTRDVFRFGHLAYDGDGKVAPLLRVDRDHAVPVIGIAAFSPQVSGGRLVVAGKPVPLATDGGLIANLPNPARMMERTFNMVGLVKLAREGRAITPVEEGDVVLILPAMYTGNTDWHSTAFGRTAGGFVHASVINSVLTNKWISEWRHEVLGVLAGSALGLALALLTWGMTFLCCLAGATVLATIATALSFAYADVMVCVLWPTTALVTTALIVMFERTRAARLAQVTIEQDLATARLVQDTFLPRQGVASSALRLTSFYRSASTCSGDWWTQFSIGKRFHCFAIGDAVGHGTPAALVTAMAYATFMTVAEEIRTKNEAPLPDVVLARFNRVLFDAVQSNFSMSCFFAVFDVEASTMTYANAGHPFPMLITADPLDPRNPSSTFAGGQPVDRRAVIRLRDPGGLLGMDSEVALQRKTIEIRPGDRLVMFTDGMYECRAKNETPFGFRNFSAVVLKGAETDLETMKTALVAEIERFIGPSTPLEDDMTMVAVDYLPLAG